MASRMDDRQQGLSCPVEWAGRCLLIRPVGVLDSTTYPTLREVLLGADVGAVVCRPLLTVEKACVGVVTTYHTDADFAPTVLQAAKSITPPRRSPRGWSGTPVRS